MSLKTDIRKRKRHINKRVVLNLEIDAEINAGLVKLAALAGVSKAMLVERWLSFAAGQGRAGICNIVTGELCRCKGQLTVSRGWISSGGAEFGRGEVIEVPLMQPVKPFWRKVS